MILYVYAALTSRSRPTCLRSRPLDGLRERKKPTILGFLFCVGLLEASDKHTQSVFRCSPGACRRLLLYMPDCFSGSGDEAVQNCENCVSGEETRAGDE